MSVPTTSTVPEAGLERAHQVASHLSNIDQYTADDMLYTSDLYWNPYFYPLSNDERLEMSYREAIDRSTGDTDRTSQGVAVVVGNGSFETAAGLLPPDVPLIHIDHNPRTLWIQRLIRELISECDSPSEFYEAAQSAINPIAFDKFQVEIDYKHPKLKWNEGGSMPHFLNNPDSFQAAAEGLRGRVFGYRVVDLKEPGHVVDLKHDLETSGSEVLVANVTNVFARGHAGGLAAETFAKSLPFSADAVVMDSHRSALRLSSQCYKLGSWLNTYGFAN